MAHLHLALVAFLLTGADQTPHDLVLTPAEKQFTLALAEKAIKDSGLEKAKLVFTGGEVFRNRRAGAIERMALLSHYRYDGDLTILTSIHLDRREVVKVEAVPHLPTSLAPEELRLAEKLARSHPDVLKALVREKEPLEVDALMHYTADAKAPTYQHRVVRLFFRHGRTYVVYGPVVEVDLTTETVRVEERAAPHK